jgi:hypothetical protein
MRMMSPSPFEPKLNTQGMGMISVITVILFTALAGTVVFGLIAPNLKVASTDETFKKMEAIKTAITLYRSHHSTTPPASLTDLVQTVGPPCDADTNPASPTYKTLQGWCGPYLDQPMAQNTDDYKTDGWGTAFVYDPGALTLQSCGPDQSCGGADDITLGL